MTHSRIGGPWRCMGCKKLYANFGNVQKHGNRCIKKFKWLVKQGYMTQEQYVMNVKHVKKMGYKQN